MSSAAWLAAAIAASSLIIRPGAVGPGLFPFRKRVPMGFLSAYSGTRKIDVGGGYWVEIKECLSIAEKNLCERALMSSPVVDMSGRGSAKVDSVAFRNAMMSASIVDWNLDEDNGDIWPLFPQAVKDANIARLPGPVFDQIWLVVDESNGPRERADAVRFPDAGVVGDPDGNGGSAEPGVVLS